MNEPIIQANESLIRNGDFEQGFSHWKKGEENQSWLSRASEFHEHAFITLLKSGNKSSVSQSLEVPKDPIEQARYVLSFWCETRHTEAGKLKISIDGQQETLEILLPPGASRDVEEDQARLRNGQPLEFNPIKYRVELALPFSAGDTLTVDVSSPANAPNDPISGICITRINLQLHLEPAVMQGLMLDEEPVSPDATLYMCQGASASLAHRLKFLPAPDNAWRDTQAALSSDDNPFGAVVAVPDWGVDHPLEDRWQLDCPLIGDEEPYLFSMNLLNQYTAEPYPVNVSLGHHRLVFREVLEAAYYPVLEYEQRVRLGVQVASYYTGQSLSGRTVTWTLAGQGVKGVGVTNDQGWAYFDFEPQAHGNVVIQASVDSPYYAAGVVTQSLDVRVLATDPWKDVLAVVDGDEKRWEEKTGYPNRGSDYPVTIKLAADSPLLGTELLLRWSGDSHEQLGVIVSPALEHSVPVIGREMAWNLTSEDRLDGWFYLALVCSKLLLPSPKKTMSLARNLVKVGEVREANKFPVVDENESVLLRVQVLHEVGRGDGEPVINALVDWLTPEGTISTRSGAGGWASVPYTPNVAGDQVVTASIKAHAEAVAIEQPFNVKAIATSPWKSEVKFLLDTVEVERNTLGVVCRRGQTHTLKVVPVAGSAWVGKNISLHWRGSKPEIGLELAEVGVLKPLAAAGVEWILFSQAYDSLSSLFELELRLEGELTVRELSGRLMSGDLTEEVSLMLDQIPAALDGQAFYPCLGAIHRFNVLPNALSPLVGLESLLTWLGTPADQLGATVQPALNLRQNLSDGGVTWTLDFTASQTPGDFALALALPLLNFVASAKPMLLAHNKIRIEACRESPVDPVVGQESAWQWVQVFSHFTRHAVNQVPVTWTTPQGPRVVHTDNEGWSGIDFSPVIDGAHEIQALVISAFDSFEDKRAMGVTALASDPWEGLSVRFDGGPAHAWGEKTYFPRRKGEHTFKLFAPQNSPLFDRVLTLGMTGTGPGELGIQFLPAALGVSRMFYDVGLQYTFKVGDQKDASFALRLSSQRLASLSPANAMSLGEGAQVVKIIGHSSVDQTLDWGQEFFGQVTVVSVISGKAMVGWTVTWRSPDLGVVTSVTDFYGVAKVRFVPTTSGMVELTAIVGDGIYAQLVSLPFEVNDPRKISEFIITRPGTYPGDEVEAQVTIVSSLSGLPLDDVEVMWEIDDVWLTPTSTNAEGRATVAFRVETPGEKVLTASVRGGEGGWDTALVVFTVEGVVPVIEKLDANYVVHLDHSIYAEVLVVASNDGKGWPGITIDWTFQGATVPSTITYLTGKSQATIKSSAIGVFPLTASLADYPQSKSIEVEVVGLDAPRITRVGRLGNGYFEAFITDGHMTPIAGKTVFWRVDDLVLEPTITGADGIAKIHVSQTFGTLFPGILIGATNYLYEVRFRI
ncbi:hypothetical protein PMI22_02971 [Pseudomonas sp. GM21]|uniref:Ig-like domain-containing protein n=1 Tax=Pseudomonas sp. GM21 TaxID=1144325 RepID=UPI00027241CB|nr:Ig-like domain-containing protein [Pseudomonas sp. GM21]EJM19201.1 hypothetical protein PMI22_02971 [Pseudomonas sp. GM21]